MVYSKPYDKFCEHCLNLLDGRHADGKIMKTKVTKEFSQLRLKKFLSNTRQIQNRDKFCIEFAEHLI